MSSQAASPFDNSQTADIVLRSSDDVLFRVHKNILQLASPFFATMFGLPQPSTDSSTEHDSPVIPVSEHSNTLNDLLRICYPVVDPPLNKIDRVRDVLAAAIKYDMKAAKVVCRKALQGALLSKEPLGVYAVAVQFGLKVEALAAAKQSLRDPMKIGASDTPPSALDGISGTALYRLLQYQQAAKIAARKVIGDHARPAWSVNTRGLAYICNTCCPMDNGFAEVKWQEYHDRVEKVLEATPYGGAILEDGLLSSTAFVRQDLTRCESCFESVLAAVQDYIKRYAAHLEQEISKHAPVNILGFESTESESKSKKRKRAVQA